MFLFPDIWAHSIKKLEIWDIIINIKTIFGTKTAFFGLLGATIMQQNGDFDLCDRFKILDVLLKFFKISAKEMTKMVNH